MIEQKFKLIINIKWLDIKWGKLWFNTKYQLLLNILQYQYKIGLFSAINWLLEVQRFNRIFNLLLMDEWRKRFCLNWCNLIEVKKTQLCWLIVLSFNLETPYIDIFERNTICCLLSIVCMVMKYLSIYDCYPSYLWWWLI